MRPGTTRGPQEWGRPLGLSQVMIVWGLQSIDALSKRPQASYDQADLSFSLILMIKRPNNHCRGTEESGTTGRPP